ncbi:MAG: serine hydrolase domain-containing protein [Actinomycetota bacterium]
MSRFEQVARALRTRVSVVGRPVIRNTLADRMTQLRVPAVGLAVLEDGGSVSSRAWGATPGTLFQAASISKPVTAMAVGRLAADGVIDIDRDVNTYLRTWQLPDGDGVTVRRILSHSAGLSVHGFPGYALGADIPSIGQILDGAPPSNSDAVRVVLPPGETYQYSGGGFTVLQLLLTEASEEPFAGLMRRTVLAPLGMDQSTYEQPLPPRLHPQAAIGHDDNGQPLAGGWRIHPEQAAAGLWTPPHELIGVAGEMIRPGRVLDEAGRDKMLVPQTNDRAGLGWGLDGSWFSHGGANAGFRCDLAGSVPHGRAAVVMTNGDAGGALCGELLAAVAEVFGWPDYLRERSAIDLDAARLDEMAGDYAVGPELTLSIRRAGDSLVGSAPGVPEGELYASTPTDLYRLDLDAEIKWSGDSVTISMGGLELKAVRKGS